MTRRLTVGVVGAGIGAAHIAAYRELPKLYSVEAICDIDAAKAGKIAADNGIAAALTDFNALIQRDLDLVSICTPSGLHFEQARKALTAGRNVVLEKPFASSLAEADALAEIEQQSGRRLSPVFQYRFADGIAQLLHLRELGLVGKTYAATVETHWRRLPAYYDNPWRGRWASELGGCLITHAIHNHDMLTHVLGPIRSVYARTATRVNPIETEDCAAAVLEMADGSFATLSVTLGGEEEISRLRFCFDGLTAESNHSPYNPGSAPWRFVAADPQQQRIIDAAVAEVAPQPDRYTGQFLRLHRALTEGGPLPVSIADARPSLELVTAAYHSARTGQAVQLPITRDHPLYSGWLPGLPQPARERA
jgi:predicted dehydrogenase